MRYSVLMIVVLVVLSGCQGAELDERREAVALAGSQVMPFDLDATTHVFEKLPDGGLQTVVADSDDPRQIDLIRMHLAEEVERFSRGDFSDPAAIHGEDMPGLHALMIGHNSLSISYSEVERGAAIRYQSQSAALVTAIHQWFDAQMRDHGDHAQSHR